MIRAALLALALPTAALATAALATADGPDFWRVVGVASDDTLNIRVGPGTTYPVSATFAHNARKLRHEVCVPTINEGAYYNLSTAMQQQINAVARWCLVSDNSGNRGWVLGRFLAEDG